MTSNTHPSLAHFSLPLRYLVGVLIALLVALSLFYAVMRPPFGDLRAMATFLAITAVLSLVAGYVAYRGGWLHRMPRLSWALMGIYLLASILTFLNVWVTARLMFASYHDLMLATILLLFAGGIATALVYFLSAGLTDRIRVLCLAADEIAHGKLSTRVPIVGRDEMTELAVAFNAMAGQLETAAQKQRELEAMRRDLIAWAGHDLRTPLASVRAIVEGLADGIVEDSAEQQRYLRTAEHDIRSLSGIIDDLFELAQLEAGGLKLERSPNSLSDLISDTIESFSALAAQQGVTLQGSVEAETASDMEGVEMDVSKIGRVLANLTGNALRHTSRGGQVSVHATRTGEQIQVSVCDTGEGIAPDDLPRVFERFYRGEKSRSRETGGAGLGLAIAKGIVEAHGGRIWADNRAAGGACFTFTLPASPA